jgi:carbon-monoxide dehydrogenase large subunit
MRFGIGEAVQRTEDPVLLRGEGRYTDDLNEPGQAYAYIVRSQHAHGVLKKIDVEAAKAMPGVLAIRTSPRTGRTSACSTSSSATARR